MKFAPNFIFFIQSNERKHCFRILTRLIVKYRLSFQDFLEKIACILVTDLPF